MKIGNHPVTRKHDDLPEISNEDGTLCIDCIGCLQHPDACSPACISCICDAACERGCAPRIRLHGIREVEIIGKGAELLCSLAQVSRPVALETHGRRCGRCRHSPERLIDDAWSTFPDMDFDSICSRLYSDRNDGPECAACMQRTYNILKNSEAELEAIRRKVSDPCKLRRPLE